MGRPPGGGGKGTAAATASAAPLVAAATAAAAPLIPAATLVPVGLDEVSVLRRQLEAERAKSAQLDSLVEDLKSALAGRGGSAGRGSTPGATGELQAALGKITKLEEHIALLQSGKSGEGVSAELLATKLRVEELQREQAQLAASVSREREKAESLAVQHAQVSNSLVSARQLFEELKNYSIAVSRGPAAPSGSLMQASVMC